jgi:hypothetical protein
LFGASLQRGQWAAGELMKEVFLVLRDGKTASLRELDSIASSCNSDVNVGMVEITVYGSGS